MARVLWECINHQHAILLTTESVPVKKPFISSVYWEITKLILCFFAKLILGLSTVSQNPNYIDALHNDLIQFHSVLVSHTKTNTVNLYAYNDGDMLRVSKVDTHFVLDD